MILLLASRSAARRRLLEAAGVPFEVRTADFDEEAVKAQLRVGNPGAETLAASLSQAKALSVPAAPGELVLGADQVLERDDGSTLDKPTSRAAAGEQLRSLSGRAHRLHAGAAIAEAGRIVWRCTESVRLHVRPLGDSFLDSYLEREYEAIRHGVGGYRIEGPGVQLFEKIEGSHFAILGLPLLPLLAYLRQRGLMEN